MFMYLWKNWDLEFIGILSFEIGIWGLDLGFGFGHGISDLRIKDVKFLCKIGILDLPITVW